MSLSEILRSPTRNTAWYLFPRNLLVFYLMLLFGCGVPLVLVAILQHWLLGSLMFNLFLVGVVGISAREQLTYAFAACLPQYQPALRRHLLLVGIVANGLLVVAGVVFYRVPVQDKLDMTLGMLCGGIALYLVLSRLLLGTRNIGYWNLIFTGLLLLPYALRWDISPHRPFVMPLNFSMRLALLLLACLAMAWFWQLLARPGYFRKVIDVPMVGGFDSSNSMEAIFGQYALAQRTTERRRQHTRLAHWVSTVSIPGHSCVSDHLNVVLNRALTLLTSPALWMLTAFLCVTQSFIWTTSGPGFTPVVMLYPMLLLLFILKGTEMISASPLLPYSRMERALGLLAGSLVSLLLFLAYLWLTWQGSLLLAPLLHQGTISTGRILSRDVILAILLCVPAYYMVQLLMSVMRTGAVFVFSIASTACLIVTVIAAGAIASSHPPDSEVHLLWWFAIGWGLYLLLLYLRFRRGSLHYAH